MMHAHEDTSRRSGFSRREFLKGSGVAAAATALAQQSASVAQEQGVEVVRGKKRITVEVNGEPVSVEVETRTTLLEMLRYQLDLTGAKPVSTDGSCGASTVLVDGKPALAAALLAIACDGKKIQTVESLAKPELDPVPKAFVEHDAQQCGFCTPGFVMAVRAFLNQHPHATEEEIRNGLNGNICRCGTYANVFQAVLSLVKGGANG
ncbi:MAG: aldehyde dehydrogenase iron-sulfur subunit [Pirellulaceae bacterium]|nr:MAG: aldehyde dehydrogenase iron-sulfur subunit [Pirellulaceae bacterium]